LLWEVRLAKIKRQLLQYSPDFMCIQCIQSVGNVERCSEWDAEWFQDADQPDSNHLVHMYRELSNADYAVTFVPTLSVPGNDTICFGNAVFWKRWRWQQEQQWTIPSVGLCIELASHGDGHRVLLCSAKSAVTYAQDWGDKTSVSELVGSSLRAQKAIKEAVSLHGAQPVWCGDFGCEASLLLPRLSRQITELTWQSAGISVLAQEQRTSLLEENIRYSRAVDFILHADGLEALAVLGNHDKDIDITEWFKMGNPSDHVMVFSAFAVKPDA
jgi:hypothetical protein